MRIFEETFQEGKAADQRVLIEVSYKEGKLLLEMCDRAVSSNPRKKSYKTMVSKLEELPIFSIQEIMGSKGGKRG